MNTTTLAIHGGPKAVTLDQTAANRWPIITAEDEAAVIDVMRHGDLSCHPVTRELEHDYQQRFGRTHALAHANGTLALLAAFHALNLKPGDALLAITPRKIVVLQLLYLYINERKHHDQAFRCPGRRPDRHLRFRR